MGGGRRPFQPAGDAAGSISARGDSGKGVFLPIAPVMAKLGLNTRLTQGMRQGNDTGTQYRSGIYTTTEAQKRAAEESKLSFGPMLLNAGLGAITTEIINAPEFFFAEDYHQQYLSKNPSGYCGIGGTGVTCPIGTGVSA